MSTLHRREDSRIFWKEALSLHQDVAAMNFAVMDGRGNDVVQGVNVVDLGAPPKNRGLRLLVGNFRVYRLCRKRAYGVVHFHDPELILSAVLLSLHGKKIIYDVHEDLPRQIYTKQWIPHWIKKGVSNFVDWVETRSSKVFFSAAVCATPIIAKRFGDKAIVVRNLPRRAFHLNAPPVAKPDDCLTLVYVGGIMPQRGVRRVVNALAKFDGKVVLRLVGPFGSQALEDETKSSPGWPFVDYQGEVPHEAVPGHLMASDVGVVLLDATKSYMESLPIKLFEYMSLGLPVLASDFPVWRELIADANCAWFIDPEDNDALLEAIAELLRLKLNQPQELADRGDRGKQEIVNKLNWDIEFLKLKDLYIERIGVRPNSTSS